jgi:hypothetical protein
VYGVGDLLIAKEFFGSREMVLLTDVVGQPCRREQLPLKLPEWTRGL